jgi:hypothetical protein
MTLLPEAIIVSSSVYYAVQPHLLPGQWAASVIALIPIEALRLLVLWIERDAYSRSGTARDAMKYFLAGCTILAGIVLVTSLGPQGVLVVLTDRQVQSLVVPPLVVTMIDGVVGFYSLKGSPQVEAAKFEALASDGWDWLVLSIARWGPVVLIPIAFVTNLRSQHLDTEAWRRAVLMCVAVYFGGKAIVFAHIHTAHFLSTGKCLLGVNWIQAILVPDRRQREQGTKDEALAAERRRAALSGASVKHAGA